MADKKKPRYGVWFIIILLLVGLAGFGAGGFSGNIRSIGTAGEKEIAVQAYQRALRNQINRLQQQFGQAISFQQAQAFGIDQAALGQLVLTRTLDNETANLGLSVGDEQVLDRLTANPQFQGAGGFNPETYRLAIAQLGQTEEEFETGIREELSRNLLQTAVIGGLPAPRTYGETLAQYVAEERSVTWATVTADDLTAPVPGPQPADLQTFYDENPEDFTLPETRNITYAWITPSMIQSEMAVTDAAIAQLYETRIADFVQPERRLVERLIYVQQAAADDARARLDAGEASFEDLVAERGLDLADVDMGDVSPADLGAAAEAVFAATPGEVVGPLNANLGPALFRVNAVLAAQETTLEEATPELRDELAADAAREVIDGSIDMITDLLAGGATLEDLSDRTDLVLGTIDWTPDTTDGIAAYESFRSAAAQVAIGDFAELNDLADGGIFALRLDGITPPTLQPFDTVSEAVETGWRAAARQSAIKARAEEISANVLPLTDFETLGLAAKTDTGLTRRSFVEGTPNGFIGEVFGMSLADVTVIEGVDSAVIVRLDDITAADSADPDTQAQSDAFAENAAAGIAQDMFEAYAEALRQTTEITIDQTAVNAVNAQF